jgi:hypothetical protein
MRRSRRAPSMAPMRILLASLTLLLFAPSAVAAYTPPRVAYFIASAEGTQTTTWNEPAHDTFTDCKGTLWAGSHGTETTKFSTTPVKVTAVETPPGANWFYGAFSVSDSPLGGLNGTASLSRTATFEGGLKDPGWCGGGDAGPGPEQPTGCGTQRGKAQVMIGWGGGKVAPSPLLIWKGKSIADCDVFVGKGASDTWTDDVTSKLAKAEVFGKRRVVTVTGSQTFNGTARSATGGDIDTSTTTRWTLTLKRAKG